MIKWLKKLFTKNRNYLDHFLTHSEIAGLLHAYQQYWHMPENSLFQEQVKRELEILYGKAWAVYNESIQELVSDVLAHLENPKVSFEEFEKRLKESLRRY